jgi:AAA15 family ATPase/GTPase
MLIRFSVENYLSFRDRVELSMVAGPVERHPHHVVRPDTAVPLVKVAVIYGANASGKSNLVQAMAAAQQMILRPLPSRKRIALQPFRLDAGLRLQPSRFEFEINLEDRCFAYGFAATTERVVEEWLYQIQGDADLCIFERVADDVQLKNLPFAGADERQFLEFTARGTLPNRLFLTECRERNVRKNVEASAVLFDVLDWFDDRLTVLFPESTYEKLDFAIEGNAAFKDNLSRMLQAFDTGIDVVCFKETQLEDHVKVDADDLERIDELLDAHGRFVLSPSPTLRLLVDRDEQGRLRTRRLVFHHQGTEGAGELFEMSDESDGTRRLLDLAPALLLLVENDRVFVIDEFDRSLHPELAHSLLDNFLRYSEGRRSQLIVTTHETTLLDQDFLRRDEIWLMEKGRDQSTRLIGLEEYQGIPPEDDLQRDYLQGRFGGVPVLRDFKWMRPDHAEGT